MRYTIQEIKNRFPKINLDFLNQKLLHKLLVLLEGRMVGGVVRDSLLGIRTNDLDIGTPYNPHKVFQILEENNFKPVGTGLEYGTISLFFKDYKIEITSLRKDVKNFGRKAMVEFDGTWEEDSFRRDFTFNGLFLSLEEQEWYIYDYHNGLKDLENGIVNFIGSYQDRIQEDYLRILRFIRFFIRYSKNKDYISYMNKFQPFISEMSLLSIERILMEIESILKTDNWILGIEMINNFQISKLFFKNNLLNSIEKNILNPEDRIIYVLSSIDSSIINNLPIKKNIRNYILYYKLIVKDFSIESIYYIWNKTKNLKELYYILNLCKININHTYFETDEIIFENFRKSIPIIYKEGIERGLEEKNIKILFIKKYILCLKDESGG